MKFTKIPENTFKNMQFNAGVIMKTFDPMSAAATGVLFATSGGLNFKAKPSFKDMGESIDNCPKNTAELKKLDTWDVSLSGTAKTITPAVVQSLAAAADVSGEKITPRNDLKSEDFSDIWWVGDYSDNTTEENGGFVAIHMMKALSTEGFQLQTTDKDSGSFAFTYAAHYSVSAQDTVPFEVYVKAGGIV